MASFHFPITFSCWRFYQVSYRFEMKCKNGRDGREERIECELRLLPDRVLHSHETNSTNYSQSLREWNLIRGFKIMSQISSSYILRCFLIPYSDVNKYFVRILPYVLYAENISSNSSWIRIKKKTSLKVQNCSELWVLIRSSRMRCFFI